MPLILATDLITDPDKDGSPKVIPWGTPFDKLPKKWKDYAKEMNLLKFVPDEADEEEPAAVEDSDPAEDDDAEETEADTAEDTEDE